MAQTLLTRAKVSQHPSMGQNGEKSDSGCTLGKVDPIQLWPNCCRNADEENENQTNMVNSFWRLVWICELHKHAQHPAKSFGGISVLTIHVRVVLCPVKRVIDVLRQLSFPPSSRLPPTLPALRYCVTLLGERACTRTLGPSIHKRRGWRS